MPGPAPEDACIPEARSKILELISEGVRPARPAPTTAPSHSLSQQPNMSDSESYSSGSSNADPVETSWDDWTEDSAPAASLFSDDVFPSAQLALENDKKVHGVDIVLLAATLGE